MAMSRDFSIKIMTELSDKKWERITDMMKDEGLKFEYGYGRWETFSAVPSNMLGILYSQYIASIETAEYCGFHCIRDENGKHKFW